MCDIELHLCENEHNYYNVKPILAYLSTIYLFGTYFDNSIAETIINEENNTTHINFNLSGQIDGARHA